MGLGFDLLSCFFLSLADTDVLIPMLQERELLFSGPKHTEEDSLFMHHCCNDESGDYGRLEGHIAWEDCSVVQEGYGQGT